MTPLDTELFKKCLLQGPIPKLVEEDGYLVKYFDKFFIYNYKNTVKNPNLKEFPRNWRTFDFGEPHNINGRCNFMWLTNDGRAVATNFEKVSHFTILNWTIYNMINTYNKKPMVEEIKCNYWDPYKVSKYDIHLPVMLDELCDIETNQTKLASYMKKIMIDTSIIRLSGPHRNQKFGGSSSGYGHAHKLLETPDFTIESFTDLAKSQIKFIKLVISKYNLTRNEIFINDFTKNQTMERDIL